MTVPKGFCSKMLGLYNLTQDREWAWGRFLSPRCLGAGRRGSLGALSSSPLTSSLFSQRPKLIPPHWA